jgi:hypothetical protein
MAVKLKLNYTKVDCSGKRLMVGKFQDFETHFRIK